MVYLSLSNEIFHYKYILFTAIHFQVSLTPVSYYNSMRKDEKEKPYIQKERLNTRPILIALAGIFQQIRKLQKDQWRQVNKIHTNYAPQYKIIEEESNDIILGKPISPHLHSKIMNYFSAEEQTQARNIASAGKNINNYWITVLQNFYGDQMTESDKNIAQSIRSIFSNLTEQYFQLSFDVGPNEWIEPLILTKRFFLQDGILKRIEGDNAVWIRKKPQSLFSILFSSQLSKEDLDYCFRLADQFFNEIIPYSLNHYMGYGQQANQFDLASGGLLELQQQVQQQKLDQVSKRHKDI